MNCLRQLREEAGLSQEQLARVFGYEGPGPIGCYERASQELSLRDALAYSMLFDVPIADLVPELAAEVHAIMLASIESMEMRNGDPARDALRQIQRRLQDGSDSILPDITM